MKLSDFVCQFIKEQVADTIFLISGGHAMHLVDSIGQSGLTAICNHHEQAVIGAADGFARLTNKIGVACVTLPGVPNAITGLTGAWLDSIPVLVITGQVKNEHMAERENGWPKIRQLGFQEVDTINLARPVTKYAVSLKDPTEIRYHLEKAVYLATHGRPGPVLLEIPLDIQPAEIDPDKLKSFDPAELPSLPALSPETVDRVADLLREAKRPLLMAGAGVRLSGGAEVLQKFLAKTEINVVTPIFTADDLVTYNYPRYLGRQGMPGSITANYAIDNCDLLLIVGERMQLTQTSFDYDKFASQAKIIMVDIDTGEMEKKTLRLDYAIHADAKEFLVALMAKDIILNRWDVPVEPIVPNKYAGEEKYLNIYKFFERLNQYPEKMDVATANGLASVSSHQALHIGKDKRFITNAGLGHMGSGLPMAIGACLANGRQPVLCMEGDGSIMMNIQELQTVVHHQLPLKIFIFNNNGYYSIRNTHKNFFQRLFASDPENGVTLPDYSKLAPAWGLKFARINNNDELDKLDEVMGDKGPIVCELMLDPWQPILPKWMAGMYTVSS